MIIVKITGGLGNQMFQYAAARAVAIRTQSELILDLRGYQTGGDRRYGLDAFAIQGSPCRSAAYAGLRLPPPRQQLLYFGLWMLTTGRTLQYVRERNLRFTRQLTVVRVPAYLHGYFQSEMYFQDVAPQIREELTVQHRPTGENLEWLQRIEQSLAVSVHVRRGDYVSDRKASQVHGTCSPEYYRRAAELLLEKLPETPTFYLFSDDADWSSRHIQLPGPTHILRHNDDAHNFEDLRLMRACQHHIVANSSFSWWGAWLGCNPQREVVAPQHWFRDPQKIDTDLVPKTWLRS